MLECLIIGDSIAVGLQQFKPHCEAVARGGINTWQFNKQNNNQSFGAKTVIISLGTNDHSGVKTLFELQKLRNRVYADRVFWILPAGNLKASNVDIRILQQTVRQVANEYGDEVLAIPRLSKDNIHPSWNGYKELSEKIR